MDRPHHKISDLIRKLDEFQENHGDIEVTVTIPLVMRIHERNLVDAVDAFRAARSRFDEMGRLGQMTLRRREAKLAEEEARNALVTAAEVWRDLFPD